MLDLNEAHKILGVSKNASKNDIERRYSIILKKHRMNSTQDQESGEQINIDEVTSAYNLLMGYVEPQAEEEAKAPNPLMQKMGIDEKKAKNFFYYYKIHIIVGIVLLLVVAGTIRGCVTRVEPDFNMAFVGQIDFTETDALKKAIQTELPDIKEPGFDGAFISAEGTADGQQEYAMQMKSMVLFAAADIDLFILDTANYKKYAEEGAFIALDDIAPGLGVDKEKSKPYVVKAKEETAEHVYGINITSSEVLKKSGILGQDFVAAIPARSKNLEKAEKVIGLLLK